MGKNINEMTTRSSVCLLIGLAGFVSFSMLYLELATRVTLVLAIVLTSVGGLVLGHSTKQIESYIVEGAKRCGYVITILLIIGMVIGAWIVSGIIPSIIYYGLEILTPTTFLIGGLFSTSVVSYFTGSSYACMGTLGVALMGIGQGLGLPMPLTAGMVLSGAIFGDKMSPFSDTTNLASASAGVPLFSHIHSMLYTTIPAWIIAAILFVYLGSSSFNSTNATDQVTALQSIINNHFNISPVLLLVPVLTIFLAIRKVPSVIAMSFGALTGIIAAFIFQGDMGAKIILTSLISGIDFDFGSPEVNQLFANRGGLASMLYAVSIALLALILGEILMKLGMLGALIKGLEKFITNTASLVICTIFTCLTTVLISASEYLSIVMPGETLKLLYKKRGVSRKVLSRSLEDGGTIFASLVPWSAAAVFAASTLGVPTMEYLPYAFFLLLCPTISIIYAIIGYAIWYDKDDEETTAPL